ncbi:hypothetical protein KC345_g9495 [Hortaea werneckii]|nr:hypothetical protein KC345_g9495 [Hortaea werneckii]
MLLRSFVALFVEPDMGPLSANLAQYLYYMGMFFLLIVGIAAFILLSNEHSYEKLKRIATYDSLTGILGRRAFLMEAEVKLAMAARKRECYSLLLLDLDHFKKVNDTYGHDKGDGVLQDFALTIESNLGNGDLFGRVGGEEFAVMLYGLDEYSSTLKAEQLREAVKEASKDSLACRYTVSIGIITVLPDPQTSLNSLYKLSDRALYQAKQDGRDRVVRAGSRYPKDGTSRLFLTAKIIQLVILTLLMLREYYELRFALPCIILLNLAGGTAEIFALLKLLDVYTVRVKNIYYALAGGASICLLVLYSLLLETGLLIDSAALAGALLLVYPAYILAWKVNKTPLQEIMGLLYGLVILVLVMRASGIFYSPPQDSPLEDWIQVFFYIGIYLLMFLGTAGFMLLSREQSYAELERVATYDELTGILNRRAFVLRARPLIAAAAKEVTPFSFLLLDVDHFKQVNDTYGHDTGDKVLRDFARRIESQLGNGDLFGRFGGEEFAVLLHRADEEESDEAAERLRRSVLDATIEGVSLPYTVSIGLITIVSGERVPLNTLYKLSDTALYQAKQRGRNCVVRSREHGVRELEARS